MDETRLWAELVATQLLAQLTLANLVHATTADSAEREARCALLLDAAHTMLAAVPLQGASESDIAAIREGAAAKLDLLISAIPRAR